MAKNNACERIKKTFQGKNMVVGYALGNRKDQEADIDVLAEDAENAITYSKSTTVCLYDYFTSYQKLLVPYSTIRAVKQARQYGAREVIYSATDRPHRYQQIKSLLELWGFGSYTSYLYTVTELGFLEGLLPVMDVGFLGPDEMRALSEITSLMRVPIESLDSFQQVEHQLIDRKLLRQYRLKNLEWASKLKIPTATGFVIGSDLYESNISKWLDTILDLHDEFGLIHELRLEVFREDLNLRKVKGKVPSKSEIVDVIKRVRSVLPDSITVNLPIEVLVKDVKAFIKAGIRDFGSIDLDCETRSKDPVDLQALSEKVDDLGFTLQQRFPLKKKFILEEKYSKKLGQVFDAYRYKIRKDLQEKQKDSRT